MARFGVRLVWVVHLDSKTVDIRSAGSDGLETLTEADCPDGTPVLPGFGYRSASCPRSEHPLVAPLRRSELNSVRLDASYIRRAWRSVRLI